ncbi:hypothetical protein [Phaeovulum veldkampii]|uniref:hypothetical protein n=1 Tax=Phaeovulum veldkampii TaxID=33049 RepID=UPI0014560148|nr:hypothetical protein [Phaeovulum veldkampii]
MHQLIVLPHLEKVGEVLLEGRIILGSDVQIAESGASTAGITRTMWTSSPGF